MSIKTAILTLFIFLTVALGSACTPHEVQLFQRLAPHQQDAVVTHIQSRPGSSRDCYEAIDRHWPAASRSWARGIVWRESRNSPSAANKGSSARGCWQLLLGTHSGRFHKLGFSPTQWANPDVNTLVALDLYREAGTSPWNL